MWGLPVGSLRRLIGERPRSSCVAMLGSLELLTRRPEGDGGDLEAVALPEVAAEGLAGRGSGDRSRSDSGEEA